MKKQVVVWMFAFLAAGCGGDEEGSCPTGGRGTLNLTISGLPDGTAASVRLQGPGREQTATASGRLENLSSGRWTVTAQPVAAPGGLVRRAYDGPDGMEVCVPPDDAAATSVAYALIPSSAKLWTGAQNSPAPLLAWAQEVLGTTGTAAPTVQIDSRPQIATGRGVTFDRLGNLWAADSGGRVVRRYAAGELGQSGERVPDLVIGSEAFGNGSPGPVAVAFDGSGNLWVAAGERKQVARFSPAQLTTTGEPVAEVTLSTGTVGPSSLAFDAAGNLWLSAGNRVLKYAAGRLGASSNTPDLILRVMDVTAPTSELSAPAGLAFDASGNLWVAYFGRNVIARLTPGELSGSGEQQVTPTVQLKLGVGALLDGLTFDEEGGLWTPLENGQLGRFAPSQLTAAGSVTPQTQVSASELGAAHGLAIFPAPAGTPLHHRLP